MKMHTTSLRAWILLLSLAVPATRANTGMLDRLTPSPAPSDAPSDAPAGFVTDAPTLSPAAAYCADRTEKAQHCVQTKLENNGTACDTCVATALQGLGPLEPDLIDCDTFSEALCGALETCECGDCVRKLERFLDCSAGERLGCKLECDAAPTAAGTTAAPSATEATPTAAPAADTTAAPSAAITAAPSPTLAPAAATTSAPTSCPSSQETLQTCFAEELGGDNGCDTCLATVLQDLGIVGDVSEGDVNCTDYENHVCHALESCPCGDCVGDAKTYLNCNISPKIGCSLSCLNDTCPVTPGEIQTCFAEEVLNPTCGGCLAGLLGNLTEDVGLNMSDISSLGNLSDILGGALEGMVGDFNCSYYQTQACEVLSVCDCGSCFGDVGTYLDCSIGDATGCYLNGCGLTDAPSSGAASEAPAPAPTTSCDDIASEAIACLADLGDIGQACNTCVAGGIPTDASDCTTFEASVCSSLGDCSCGDCASVVEQYLSCTLDAKVGCPISC